MAELMIRGGIRLTSLGGLVGEEWLVAGAARPSGIPSAQRRYARWAGLLLVLLATIVTFSPSAFGAGTLSLSAGSTEAIEGAQVDFTITREDDLSGELSVALDTGGDADDGDASVPASVTMVDGEASRQFTVKLTDDSEDEPDETLEVRLVDGADYQVGEPAMASVTIVDNDPLPTITVTANTSDLAEDGEGQVTFSFSREGGDSDPLEVHYRLEGEATSEEDYTANGALSGVVSFPADRDIQRLQVFALDDDEEEGDEAMIIALEANPAYQVGQPDESEVIIRDDDLDIPRVNLGLNKVVEEGDTIEVTASLTNETTVPLEIPFRIRGDADGYNAPESGTFDFEPGATESTLSIEPQANDVNEGDRQLVVELQNPTNARLGVRLRQIVVITDRNVAPKVTLAVRQGDKPARLLTKDGGNVVVTAEVDDVNSGDSHTFAWQALTNNALPRIDADPSAPNTFVFDPTEIVPGFYKIGVAVSDDAANPGQTRAEVQVRIVNSIPEFQGDEDADDDGIPDREEGAGDDDHDGIPNFRDPARFPSHVLQGRRGTTYRLEAEPGLSLALGDVAHAAGDGHAEVSVQEIIDLGAGEGQPGANAEQTLTSAGGYYDFQLTGLKVPGDSVRVVVPQREPIPENGVYRKYTPGTGWVDFEEDEDGRNRILTAPGNAGNCPPPGDPAYTPELTAGDFCVQLVIQDGGPNDADGEANYRVADPGGVVVPADAPVVSAQPEACGNLICADDGGGAALSGRALAVLLAVVLLTGGWRQRCTWRS